MTVDVAAAPARHAATWYERKRTRELALVVCFLLPALSIFFLYRILPLGWNLWLSFHAWSPLKAAKFIGLENYEEMLFDDDVFWQALANTLIFIGASPLAIALALAIALVVNSDLRGAAIYRTIVFLSYPLMTVAVGIIWRWLYDVRGGFFNWVLRSAGIVDEPVKFLQSFDWALPCVILADFWQVLGFYMIILLTGLQSIPQHLYEAARVDGVPAWTRFWRITLPLLSPTIFFATVVGVIGNLQVFAPIFVMTQGGPNRATEVVVLLMYNTAFNNFQYSVANAMAIVLFVIILVLTVVQMKVLKRGAAAEE